MAEEFSAKDYKEIVRLEKLINKLSKFCAISDQARNKERCTVDNNLESLGSTLRWRKNTRSSHFRKRADRLPISRELHEDLRILRNAFGSKEEPRSSVTTRVRQTIVNMQEQVVCLQDRITLALKERSSTFPTTFADSQEVSEYGNKPLAEMSLTELCKIRSDLEWRQSEFNSGHSERALDVSDRSLLENVHREIHRGTQYHR